MKYHENVEKIFMDEVREKKRTGSGSYHKRGKGVKHGINGAFRTPYYFMKTKEKKKLNGEVSVYNMYTVIPKEEFLLKDIETQKMLMTTWRDTYSNDHIMKEMGLSSSGSFHKLIKDLDIPKKSKWNRRGTGQATKKDKSVATTPKKKKDQEPEKESEIQLVFAQEKEVAKTSEIKPILISRGLHLEYNGDYDAEQLNKIFTKLQLLTDGEDNKFSLAISLTERA